MTMEHLQLLKEIVFYALVLGPAALLISGRY